MELKKCLECMLYKESVCGVECKDKNISDAKCIERLQELNCALRQATADMVQDRKMERCITEEAIKDLESIRSCKTCGNRTPFCDSNPDSCDGYVWRGADPKKMKKIEEVFSAQPVNQELLQSAKELIGQLTDAIEKGTIPEKKPVERSYLDMVTDLYASLDTDTTLPYAEKETAIRHLRLLKTILWKYSA